MSWKDKPTELEYIPDNVRYIITIDESGQSSNFNNIKKKVKNGIPLHDTEKILCLTATIISTKEFNEGLGPAFVALKQIFWPPDGCWINPKTNPPGLNRKIHFHACEMAGISTRKNAYRHLTQNDYIKFRECLLFEIEMLDFVSISVIVNNENLIKKYSNPFEHYILATLRLIERVHFFLQDKKAKGVVIFESRASSDNEIHSQLVNLSENGTTNHALLQIKNINKYIEGFYFNPKVPHNNHLVSYVAIELTDLICTWTARHYRNIINNKNFVSPEWKIIEKKIHCFPDYVGKGLKIIP